MKPPYDELLSNIAFSFNLRCYSAGCAVPSYCSKHCQKIGQYRLTVSKPTLIGCMISALETVTP